jgi:hypothetical protein
MIIKMCGRYKYSYSYEDNRSQVPSLSTLLVVETPIMSMVNLPSCANINGMDLLDDVQTFYPPVRNIECLMRHLSSNDERK